VSDTRTAGKLGALPAQFPGGLCDLTYYVAGALPKPPPSVAVPEVSDWGILGNDQYGDCGVAGLEHVFMADASITHETEPEASDAQGVDYYLDYTSGADTGVVLSQYLAHVRQKGYYDHQVSAYAPVTVHDVPTLQTAIDLFGAVYTGIAVVAPMQQAFAEHQPWTTGLLDSPVVGGHCVPLCGYDDQYLYAITWGGVQAITYPAWHRISTEAWCVLTGEFEEANGDGRGVSLSALKADLDRL
jgi:hypothetical protein